MARRDIARRLLARPSAAVTRAAAGTATNGAKGIGSYRGLIGALALLPAAAIAIYAVTGAPGLPGRPYLPRAAAPVQGTSVDELIARVEARLREHPDDGQGWDVIAPVYLRQERFREAADAFGHALRLLGPTVKRLSGFGEATIVAGSGVVSEEAKNAYEQVLKLEPEHVEARFWLAMAKEQDGALEAAAADYRALLAKAPDNAPWRAAVAERLSLIQQRLPPGSPTADRGRGEMPAPEAAAAIERLPPAERMQAIASMVDGLAARLAKDGTDLSGWLRLVRAYKVLGRDAAAAAALGDARKAMHGNAAALGELDALAKSLGMGS